MRATTRSHNGGQARNPATGETFSVLFRSRAERLIRLCGAGAPFRPLPCSPLPRERDKNRRPSNHHRQRNTPLPNRMSIRNIRKSVKSKGLRPLWIMARGHGGWPPPLLHLAQCNSNPLHINKIGLDGSPLQLSWFILAGPGLHVIKPAGLQTQSIRDSCT